MRPPPTIVLALSGSIAAYKAAAVARLLVRRGWRVRPIATRSATRFLGAATLSGITGEPVHTDMWQASGELHVELAAEADVVALVPATADLLAALAGGRADDLVRATALCARGRVVAAPAMHPRMWEHPATQRNVSQLRADGRIALVGPVEGEVASGDHGPGRMAEPEEVVEAIVGGTDDLRGRHLVVSAGPTVEDLDPARYLSNRSSGKMGFAIADRACRRGARVTLVAGPVDRPTPLAVTRVDVRSAREMAAALDAALGSGLAEADALVMAAAVADYRPAERSEDKLERKADEVVLELVKNPDLLAGIAAKRSGARPLLVGFALETGGEESMRDRARRKLEEKGVDLVVANHAAEAFDVDENRVILVDAGGAEALDRLSKVEVADRILDRVAAALGPLEVT